MEDTNRDEALDDEVKRENEALIEEMLREAKKAPEPNIGDEIVYGGDAEQPTPMVQSSLTSAGWAYIYNTKTGERSLCNRNWLASLLKRKFPDGTNVWTTRDPHIPQKKGKYKCMLHKDDPNRAHYDELGFAVCPKDNLISPYQVRRHMQKRHPMEWATIEEERLTRERQEDRELQRGVLKSIKESTRKKAK